MLLFRLIISVVVLCAFAGYSARARSVTVADAAQLSRAVQSAKPGDTILIAPGRYSMKMLFSAENSGTESAPVTVKAQGGAGNVIIDGKETGAAATIKFRGAGHIQIKGLAITGGQYHGVFFAAGAHHILIKGNRIYDNFTVLPMTSHAEIKGSGPKDSRPHHVSIIDNEIFHTQHPPGSNFQGIDCNFCDDIRISGNYIHDIREPTLALHSHFDRGSCIQMKSGSTNVVIERNRIARCHIGAVYGGEGMASPEHIGGIIRNNIITGSAEIGAAIVNVRGGKVMHNTFYGNRQSIVIARDIRNPDSRNDVAVTNNILDTRVRVNNALDAVTQLGNYVLAQGEGADVFRDVPGGDFRFSPGAAALIDKAAGAGGDVFEDFMGTKRPQGGGADIGALEYFP